MMAMVTLVAFRVLVSTVTHHYGHGRKHEDMHPDQKHTRRDGPHEIWAQEHEV